MTQILTPNSTLPDPLPFCVDVVSGFGETVNDGSPIWAHADKCADILGGPEFVNRYTYLADLTPVLRSRAKKRGVVLYSYAGADFFKWSKRLENDPCLTDIDWVVGIVTVNRIWDGQDWKNCFFYGKRVKKSVTFNTVYRDAVKGRLPVIPECCPCRNPDTAHQNFNCFWEGVDHCNVVALPVVGETIYTLTNQLKG